MALTTLEICFRKTSNIIIALLSFLLTCYFISKMRGHLYIFGVQRGQNQTFFEGQNLALGFEQPFLASFI